MLQYLPSEEASPPFPGGLAKSDKLCSPSEVKSTSLRPGHCCHSQLWSHTCSTNFFFNLISVHTNFMSPWTHAWHRPPDPTPPSSPPEMPWEHTHNRFVNFQVHSLFFDSGFFVFCDFPSSISPFEAKGRTTYTAHCFRGSAHRKARTATVHPSPTPFRPKDPFSILHSRTPLNRIASRLPPKPS